MISRGFGFRWCFVGACLAAAIASAMVMAAPRAMAASEKPFEVNFEAQCVLAPGVLNQKGTIKVHEVAVGPGSVAQGEQFSLKQNQITVVTPKEWGESFFALGSRSVQGFLLNTVIDNENATPAKLNIATPAEFPTGLPIKTRVEDREVEFTVPSEGRTFVSGPYTVTASNEDVRGLLDTAAGFREVTSGRYESTGEGILSEVTGFNENGEANVGPIQAACTAPSGVVVVAIPIETHPPTRCEFGFPEVASITPNRGPQTGGTKVTITGCSFTGVTAVEFGTLPARSFEEVSPSELKAITPSSPPDPGARVTVTTTRFKTSEEHPVFFAFEPVLPAHEELHSEWKLAGSLTPKKLGQPINLPAGSSFTDTLFRILPNNAWSISGSLSIPPFTAPLKVFGLVPASLGVSLTQADPVSGSAIPAESDPARLELSANLNMGITSVRLFGLKVPTSCAATEPIALAVSTTLTQEELRATGWEFAGTTSLPRIKCEGSFGPLVGTLLSLLVTGPGNPYALRFAPPA